MTPKFEVGDTVYVPGNPLSSFSYSQQRVVEVIPVNGSCLYRLDNSIHLEEAIIFSAAEARSILRMKLAVFKKSKRPDKEMIISSIHDVLSMIV